MFSLDAKVVFFQRPAEHFQDMEWFVIVYGFAMEFVTSRHRDAAIAIDSVDVRAAHALKRHFAVDFVDGTIHVNIMYLIEKKKRINFGCNTLHSMVLSYLSTCQLL